MTKIPQLDGIRGIAILLVISTHYVGFEPWTMVDRLAIKVSDFGWIGVDLFFCLSGFLITSILISTRESPSYLRDFFLRRALRIFPLYFVFVTGLLIIASTTTWPESKQWLDRQFWYWTYLFNWRLGFEGTWAAGPLRSGHLWSLAIEEQFYLLWPLVVWKLSNRKLIGVCAGIMAGALALRIGLRLAEVNTLAIFTMTFTRIDALIAGALGAILTRELSQQVLRKITLPVLASGATVLIGVLAYERGGQQYGPAMQTIGYSAIAITFAMFITAAAQSRAARSILTIRPLMWLGKVSYGLYMLHLVAFAIVQNALPPIQASPGVTVIHLVLMRAMLAFGLAIGLALISWYLLEQPFLRLKDVVTRSAPAAYKPEFDSRRPAEPPR